MNAFARAPAGVLALALGALMATCAWAQGRGPQAPQGPVRAGIVTLERGQVPVTVPLTGQAAAFREAQIRPLVAGLVTDILYDAGTEVRAGDPLFRIDPRTYDANLASAEAQLASAKAALPAAQATVDRFDRLAGTGVTQADVDTARVNLLQAQAAIRQAEAAVETARIDLDRATILSPIDGVAGISETSVGDLVTSGQADALTTVTTLDPIYVDLAQSSARMLQVRARIASGDMEAGDQLHIALRLENDEGYDGTGIVRAISSNVSTTTGTVRIRVEFANPDHLILPGMFVRARVTLGTANAFLIPQLAAGLEADGTISVWTLDDDDIAREVRLTSIGSTDNAWIVPQGLEDGTRLMVDNIDTMREGTQIDPVPVRIDASGVITETDS
ncbi:efflux RND transporter periplasmic adaptor subunit [Falsirhodobacter halotolerans]|uniref:efflux RND transporter periplasmic adaptor subunit n=1 Tax=Falsirhodobacter halotolerans TaxID=1146892 RepID=UPI001FD21832|nr:efflux RND transporter periplasmic adaptor subunit [Falsirhodobacter halotolerans]MCJ8139008.1 efflux RND transporter periplasmic adaptor subunit [Falsirhodobacter halotolerans]